MKRQQSVELTTTVFFCRLRRFYRISKLKMDSGDARQTTSPHNQHGLPLGLPTDDSNKLFQTARHHTSRQPCFQARLVL